MGFSSLELYLLISLELSLVENTAIFMYQVRVILRLSKDVFVFVFLLLINSFLCIITVTYVFFSSFERVIYLNTVRVVLRLYHIIFPHFLIPLTQDCKCFHDCLFQLFFFVFLMYLIFPVLFCELLLIKVFIFFTKLWNIFCLLNCTD